MCCRALSAGWFSVVCALSSVVWLTGAPVNRIDKAFRSARKAAGLGADVVPHTLRHTAITWQAQLGVPVHEICGFFGVTLDAFERVYGHHHPDQQDQAVNAISRRPRLFTDSFAATKRERTLAKVRKISDVR